MVSCFEVAKYFIRLAHETGSFISNMKLQKLVYYAQAWYLAIHGEPLIQEEFQAWVHGPVIPALYQYYKKYGWGPITEDVEPQLPYDVLVFLDEVSDQYFGLDGYTLERMTHQESPWIAARGDLAPDAPSEAVIGKESMREFFAAHVQ